MVTEEDSHLQCSAAHSGLLWSRLCSRLEGSSLAVVWGEGSSSRQAPPSSRILRSPASRWSTRYRRKGGSLVPLMPLGRRRVSPPSLSYLWCKVRVTTDSPVAAVTRVVVTP